MRIRLIVALLSLGLPLAAHAEGPGATATASMPELPETAADVEVPPAAKPGLGGWFDLDNSVGGGAFVANSYVNNPAWSTNLFLKPYYGFKAFGQSFKFTAWENLYYYTLLDKTAADTRQFDWSDLRFTLSDEKIYEEPHSHIKLGGSLRVVAPISDQSRFESLITTVQAGLSLSRSIYGVDISVGAIGAKEFHRFTTAEFPCSASTQEPITSGESPQGSFNAFTNGVCNPANGASTPPTSAQIDNTSWDFIPWASVTYNFNDKWNFGLTVYYFDQFAYAIPVDAQSSQIVDSKGNQVAQSQGRADSLWTIASLAYNITDHYNLSIGLWDTSLPKTPDNRAFLPWFFDPYGLATNDFTAYLDLVAQF